MENEGIVHSSIMRYCLNPRLRCAHSFSFSIFNYKVGPDPSSFSLVMDLITTV